MSGSSKSVRLWATPLTVLFLVSSCSSVPEGGPLDQDYDQGQFCWELDPGALVTVGHDILRHESDDSVEIEEVRLAEPNHGLELVEARVSPVRTSGFGLHEGFPPTEMSGVIAEMWASSVLAADAELSPSPSGDQTTGINNLIVGLRFLGDAADASTAGFEVEYRAGSRRFVYTTPTEIQFLASCDGVEG